MVYKYRINGQTPNTASMHVVHVVRVALFLSYTAGIKFSSRRGDAV